MRYGKPRLQGRVGSHACLHSSYSCGTVSPAFRVSSSTPGRFKPVILTSLHDMEGSRSFMQLYKHQYQLPGMLIKNGLGWGWVWLQELNMQRLLVGRGLDAQRLWQAREELMTYDRVPPAHYELLRGNLQKRERLDSEPRPWGRPELGSLGKKERLSSEPTPMPWGRRERGG